VCAVAVCAGCIFLLGKAGESTPGTASVITGVATHIIFQSILELNKPGESQETGCRCEINGETRTEGFPKSKTAGSILMESGKHETHQET